MIDLPQWLETHISDIECPNCGKSLKSETVTAVGIKEYKEGKNKKKKTSYLTIEHTCDYCGKSYGFDITQCDVKEYICDMIEKYGLAEQVDNDEGDEVIPSFSVSKKENDKKNQSGISQEEVDCFRLITKNILTWEAMMKSVGISKDDIEKYIKEK